MSEESLFASRGDYNLEDIVGGSDVYNDMAKKVEKKESAERTNEPGSIKNVDDRLPELICSRSQFPDVSIYTKNCEVHSLSVG